MVVSRRKKPVDKSIDLVDDTEYVNLMVYANSGAGKTVLSGSDEGVLFIAPEDQGTLSARRMGSKARKWPVQSWSDVYDAYTYWSLWANSGKPIPYKWFAIDSLTELQRVGMRSLLDQAVANNPSRDPDIPSLQDYLKNQEMFRRMIKGFNELPVNVIYTALVVQITDAEGNEQLIPDIKGGKRQGYSYCKEICGMMTSFGYLQARSVKTKGTDGKVTRHEERKIIWKETATRSGGLITAKDRTQVLAPYTVDLSLGEIRKLIDEREGEPTTSEPSRSAQKRTTKAAPRKATGTRRATTRKVAENAS